MIKISIDSNYQRSKFPWILTTKEPIFWLSKFPTIKISNDLNFYWFYLHKIEISIDLNFHGSFLTIKSFIVHRVCFIFIISYLIIFSDLNFYHFLFILGQLAQKAGEEQEGFYLLKKDSQRRMTLTRVLSQDEKKICEVWMKSIHQDVGQTVIRMVIDLKKHLN